MRRVLDKVYGLWHGLPAEEQFWWQDVVQEVVFMAQTTVLFLRIEPVDTWAEIKAQRRRGRTRRVDAAGRSRRPCGAAAPTP